MIKQILCLVATLLVVTLSAQNTKKPQLVVTIVIDGLQADHLSTLSNNFEKNGFKRLLNGTYIPQVHCNYSSSGSPADYASLVTGSLPYYHGIIGNKYYKLIEDDVVSIIYDGRFQGINSDLNVSPVQLKTTTIADVLKLNQPQGKCYAIALTPEHALILGGHVADGAIWVDDETGKLATTNFYRKGLPSWADKVNQDHTIENYLKYEWRPQWGLESYKFSPLSKDKEIFFKPNDKQTNKELIYQFKHTPFVNTLMKDLCIRALRDEKMGTDVFTDFLAVEFTVKLPKEEGNALLSAEKEDIYLRLDKEIKQLLDAIDISVGLENTLIVVAGNEQEPFSSQQLAKTQVTNGQFNAKRAMALLNSYLMALYGQERYISGYYGKNIYLNGSAIEKKKINRKELEDNVVQFMLEFQGVQNAYSSTEIKNACGDAGELTKIRNTAHKNTAGDIVFTLLPGWFELDDHNQVIGVSNFKNNYLPLILYGSQIPSQTLYSRIDITDLAPTMCNLLQIEQPNGCIGNTIKDIIK